MTEKDNHASLSALAKAFEFGEFPIAGSVVLALLSEIEGLKAERDALRKSGDRPRR